MGIIFELGGPAPVRGWRVQVWTGTGWRERAWLHDTPEVAIAEAERLHATHGWAVRVVEYTS